MKKMVLSLALCSLMSSAFADVDVVDDSQNYAFNEQRNKAIPDDDDNSVFVLSDNSENETQRGQREETVDNESSTLQLLLSKVEAMQLEIAELRGIVERQGHQLDMAGVIKNMPQKAIVTGSAHPETAMIDKAAAVALPLVKAPTLPSKKIIEATEQKNESTEAFKTSGDPMDEQLSYVAAYEHVKHKRFQEAIPAMQSFIKTYPDGPYVANAHYWLGELYGANGEYEKALLEFQTVINDFSDSSKLSSAQYKLGVIYEKIGKKELAQSEFLKVTEAFPGTSVARLAQARLK